MHIDLVLNIPALRHCAYELLVPEQDPPPCCISWVTRKGLIAKAARGPPRERKAPLWRREGAHVRHVALEAGRLLTIPRTDRSSTSHAHR